MNMWQAVIKELYQIGYEPQKAEVIEAIGKVVPRMWKDDVDLDIPALTVCVEDELFSSNRYFKSLNNDEIEDYCHRGH